MLEDELIYKRGDKFIKSTYHEFDSYLNTNKMEDISIFIDEYRRMANIFLEELWNKEYTWSNPKKCINYSMFLKHNKTQDGCPKYLQTSGFNAHKHYTGCLSGRALSSLCNQLIGIIRGNIKVAKATKTKVVKPNVDNILPELSTKHVDFLIIDDGIFGMSVRLSTMFNKRGKDIKIPLKLHKMDDYYSTELNGRLMNSIQLDYDNISLRYEMTPEIVVDDESVVIGADMGIRKICAFSNDIQTPKKNKQGKTFDTIVDSINRCKFNSNNYRRKLKERDDFINEVLNKVSFGEIDIIRLEVNKYIKLNTKNANKYWKTTGLMNKILAKCQISQVDLFHCPSLYKSQRCYGCGFVHKKNRVEENFECFNCHHKDDADSNASKNNSIILPYNDLWLFRDRNKDCGFFWNENGIVLNDKIGRAASPN